MAGGSLLLFEVPDWNLGAPVAEQPAPIKRKKNKEKQKDKEKKQDSSTPHSTPLPPKDIKNQKPNTLLTSKTGKAPRTALTAKLVGARFRYLNQKLYEGSSLDAQKYFHENPQDFSHYHDGFREQVKSWPINPVDVFIERVKGLVQKSSKPKISKRPLILVDMGCGEAKIASTLGTTRNITVHSYDLIAINQYVTEASMTKIPLVSSTADIVIFCLSLMNTDYETALMEANRVLRPEGRLWIAEVASRFDGQTGLDEFLKSLNRLGFKIENVDKANPVFVVIDAIKCEVPNKRPHQVIPKPILKPCLYKKR